MNCVYCGKPIPEERLKYPWVEDCGEHFDINNDIRVINNSLNWSTK